VDDVQKRRRKEMKHNRTLRTDHHHQTLYFHIFEKWHNINKAHAKQAT
jgi:hypothetical protein